jgi:hypothetical protein
MRIADGVDYGDRGGMPKLRIALRLHPTNMLRIAHIQFIEGKLHFATFQAGSSACHPERSARKLIEAA